MSSGVCYRRDTKIESAVSNVHLTQRIIFIDPGSYTATVTSLNVSRMLATNAYWSIVRRKKLEKWTRFSRTGVNTHAFAHFTSCPIRHSPIPGDFVPNPQRWGAVIYRLSVTYHRMDKGFGVCWQKSLNQVKSRPCTKIG